MYIYQTPSEAYLKTLEDVYFNPDYKSSPRGLPIREKLDYTFKILFPDDKPIETYDAERNATIASYTSKELDLYNSCSNKVEDFAKASKFWNNIANKDGTVNSAYGYLIWKKESHGDLDKEDCILFNGTMNKRMRTPWEWAKMSLIKDKDTRQAILRFSLPEHQWDGNKDQVCTMHGNFLIREDELHFSVVMRSNDLVLGLAFDCPFFCSLMDKMVEELKPHYPDLKKGSYTHTVHSLHIYEKNEELVKKMLGLK